MSVPTPRLQVLGFTAAGQPSDPTPPSGLTPPGGTLTSCPGGAASRQYLWFAYQEATPGIPTFRALIRSNGSLVDGVLTAPSPTTPTGQSKFGITGAGTLPSGPYSFSILDQDGQFLGSASVTRNCS